mgnify:CR=1 FL=1
MTDLVWTGWALAALLAALIALWVVWGAASRLDRLHRRVRESRATLDAQLVRRATAAWDLATAGVLDPASSIVIAATARDALDQTPAADLAAGGPDGGTADDVERAMAESELSRALREALGRGEDRAALAAADGAADLLGTLDREWYRVQLARRFHNEAVVAVRRIRAKWYVRLLRLAGRAEVPVTFEMDDEMGTP